MPDPAYLIQLSLDRPKKVWEMMVLKDRGRLEFVVNSQAFII